MESLAHLFKNSEIYLYPDAEKAGEASSQVLSFEYFQHAFLNTNSVKEVYKVLSKFRAFLGFELFAVFIRLYRVDSAPLVFIMREFENDWSVHYAQNQFFFIDPSICLAYKRAAPFIWSKSTYARPKPPNHTEDGSIVITSALDYGIKQVLSMPIHGPGKDFGIVRFMGNDEIFKSVTMSEQRTNEHATSVYGMASFVYEALSRTLGVHKTKVSYKGNLTPREKEILSWVSAGECFDRIGDRLNISVNTVNNHMRNIREKLEVKNTTHAVAKAASMGSIIL